MTVIKPNSVSGITSITAQANEINFFRSNGTLAGLNLNGVNFNTTSGISTFAALNIEGVLTYQDVTNVDSIGLITARSGINVTGGQLDVGSNIKLGNAGVVTATTFVGNLTGTATQVSLAAQSSDTDCYPVFALDATGNQTLHTKSNRLSFNSATGALSATSFVGDGSNLTGISAGTSLSGSTNNTVCTVTGANAIQGEANLTFDGSTLLQFNGTTDPKIRLESQESGNKRLDLYVDGGTAVGTIAADQSSSQLAFRTAGTERLRITSGGMVGIAHHVEGQIAKELTIRPANSGGIRYVRPGETSGSPNTHLDLTTTTSGSAFPTGEAYTVKYKTYNCDQIFETYEGGGTGGNISFRTRSSSVESVRITSAGEVWVGTTSGVSNSGYGGFSLNGSSGSLLSMMQNGTEYLRLFGDSNPAIQFAGVLRLYSGVSGGSAIWGISPNGTTTGANSVTFNLKSTIQHTTGVMAVSSSYNTGDLYIRIDNIYNLAGNAWWTFGLWIMSNQTVGTLAGHHSAMVHCVMTGLGSWSGGSFNDIQGSMASSCSVNQHGTNFVEIKLDAHDSSRGPVTVLCNGGTFDPPRISFH